MQILLRDDDTNYFTSVEELRRVYEPIWDDAPAALAVVPFQTGCKSRAIPAEMRESTETHPIGENEELVSFLRTQIDRGRVRILLHGYSHEDFPDGWEFEKCPNPHERVREGKAYLEELFDTEISTFVPPHNSLSRQCAKAVADEGLDILTAFGHWPWERSISTQNLRNFLRLSAFRLRHGKDRRLPEKLDFGTHAEWPSYTLVEDVPAPEVATGLEFARKRRGDACVAYHYWELLQEDLLEDFHDLVHDWGQRKGVEFVTDEELFV